MEKNSNQAKNQYIWIVFPYGTIRDYKRNKMLLITIILKYAINRWKSNCGTNEK